MTGDLSSKPSITALANYTRIIGYHSEREERKKEKITKEKKMEALMNTTYVFLLEEVAGIVVFR